MYVKFRIYILLFEIISLSFATTSKANRLLENLCETLNDNDGIQLDEDKQWEVICRELLNDKQDSRDVNNENNPPASPLLNKAAVRGGARAIIRTGTRGTSGGGIRTSGGSSIRAPSTIRYINTQTGGRLYRPPNSYFSPAAMIFLPLSLRHKSRSISRSNRYTTSATNPQTYYYCTSDEDDSDEIQCNSHSSGSNRCCEDEETEKVSCCSDDIPDHLRLESRATKTIERVFYTLAAITLCMHFVMRRFHR